MDTISIWKPLVSVEQQSALAFVPGSHRWLDRFRQANFGTLNPDGQEEVDSVAFDGEDWKSFPDIELDREKYGVVAWEMAPGDCVAFNGRIIHGGSGALSPERRAPGFQYSMAGRRRSSQIQIPRYGWVQIIRTRCGQVVCEPGTGLVPMATHGCLPIELAIRYFV